MRGQYAAIVADEKPNWRHSDGRPYDDLDYGHTHWLDSHDAALEASQVRPSRLIRILRALIPASTSRTLGQSRDERRFDDD
jgi:hypothetical protein